MDINFLKTSSLRAEYFSQNNIFKSKEEMDTDDLWGYIDWLENRVVGWISVEDEMPDTHTAVLVYDPKELGNHIYVDYCFKGNGGELYWDWGEQNVTHWKPLPSKP